MSKFIIVMKKGWLIILVFSFAYLVLSANLFCQNSDSLKSVSKNNSKPIILVVKTDLFFPVLSFGMSTPEYRLFTTSLTIERPIARRHSFQLTCFYKYTHYQSFDNRFGYSTWKGYMFMIIPEYKFYVSRK